MPIYEYTCADCGHDFEKLRRMSAGPPPCPSCAGERCEKQVSASAFILKGSGWYKDHYGLKKGGDSSAETSKSDAGDSKKSEAPSSTAASTDVAKPAKPSTAKPSTAAPAKAASPKASK